MVETACGLDGGATKAVRRLRRRALNLFRLITKHIHQRPPSVLSHEAESERDERVPVSFPRRHTGEHLFGFAPLVLMSQTDRAPLIRVTCANVEQEAQRLAAQRKDAA